MTNNDPYMQQALLDLPANRRLPKEKGVRYWVKIVWLDDLQTAWGYLGAHDNSDGSYEASKSPNRKPRLYKNLKVAQRTALMLRNKWNCVTVEEWKGRIE